MEKSWILLANQITTVSTLLARVLILCIERGDMMSNLEKLEQFMEGRPHDRDKNIVEATIEYIEQVENKSAERYESLNK